MSQRGDKKRRWATEEVVAVNSYIVEVCDGEMSYYRACKELTKRLDRSWESVRSQLRKQVNLCMASNL